MTSVKQLMALATTLLVAGAAVAGPTCTTAPKDKWMSEADFQAKMQADGYKIKTFKVTKGQCYEIYGVDKSGKKVEIYFDPTTAAPVESH